MTTPIPDPDDDQRTLGQLIGLFDWERLSAVTQDVKGELAAQGVSADVLVYGADGAPLGGTRPVDGAARAAARLAAMARGASVSSPDFVVDADTERIVGRAALGTEFLDLRMVVVEPRESALAPSRLLRRKLLLTMGFALAAALALAALGARRVAQPLVGLTEAIRGLAHGDARALPVPVQDEDEVGALAAAFNQMASDLERVQHDLVEAEKFAFVGELAAGIAHQIRTSLGVLSSSAQILQRSLPADSDAQVGELAFMIREEVGRLGNVVSDLLTLARGRPLRLEAIPASEVVSRAVEFVTPQARIKGIAIRSVPEPRPEPRVSCEPELIYQVALNLLVNAVQALSPGDSIELRMLEASNGFGGFELRDEGPGIPNALRERIFQPFVSGRPGGIGLGLTFVKRVIHDHRGRIELESTSGAGTRVRVELPLAEASK
jgi:signal transduction histidine kinase